MRTSVQLFPDGQLRLPTKLLRETSRKLAFEIQRHEGPMGTTVNHFGEAKPYQTKPALN